MFKLVAMHHDFGVKHHWLIANSGASVKGVVPVTNLDVSAVSSTLQLKRVDVLVVRVTICIDSAFRHLTKRGFVHDAILVKPVPVNATTLRHYSPAAALLLDGGASKILQVRWVRNGPWSEGLASDLVAGGADGGYSSDAVVRVDVGTAHHHVGSSTQEENNVANGSWIVANVDSILGQEERLAATNGELKLVSPPCSIDESKADPLTSVDGYDGGFLTVDKIEISVRARGQIVVDPGLLAEANDLARIELLHHEHDFSGLSHLSWWEIAGVVLDNDCRGGTTRDLKRGGTVTMGMQPVSATQMLLWQCGVVCVALSGKDRKERVIRRQLPRDEEAMKVQIRFVGTRDLVVGVRVSSSRGKVVAELNNHCVSWLQSEGRARERAVEETASQLEVGGVDGGLHQLQLCHEQSIGRGDFRNDYERITSS